MTKKIVKETIHNRNNRDIMLILETCLCVCVLSLIEIVVFFLYNDGNINSEDIVNLK